MIRTSIRALGALAFCATLGTPAQAHNLWLLPSSTVMSSPQWVTVDAAVSNDLFYFNHVPLALDNLVVVAPDGSKTEAQNKHRGKLRSVFDLQLDKPGTWRIAVVNRGLFASYRLEGQPKRWRGNPDQLASQIPAGATDLQVTESLGRVETFVTVGNPTAFEATGQGLELVADSHPNDLFSGESTSFRLLLDGKPAADIEVSVIPGGTRYRDGLDEIKLKTDAEGRIKLSWPKPGLYWLEASAEDERVTMPQASKRRLGYTATLEVFPQ
jgi:uncharacterized GH25 family protein